MKLRQILAEYTLTDEEFVNAEAAAEAALTLPRCVHSHLSGMIAEKIAECRAFREAAKIIEGLHTTEELDSELTMEKQNLFVPMFVAKTLLLQQSAKSKK